MKITADGEKLFIGDSGGQLNLILSRDGELIKDFGRSHVYGITVIMITIDQKFFFTSSDDGVFKQWNYKEKT